MKFDTSKIAGFDAMTAEEKVAAILSTEIDAMPSSEALKLKNALNKASSDTASIRKQLNERMTAEELDKEKQAKEQQEMLEELQALRREKAVSGWKTHYMSMGYSEELAQSTAEARIDGNEAAVRANELKHSKDYEAEIRAKILKEGISNPAGSGVAKYKTKDDIMSIKDTVERQKAIAENPELFGVNRK